MHGKRVVVALVSLPLLYLTIMYLPPIVFALLLVGVALIALSEFYEMYHLGRALKYVGLLSGSALVMATFAYNEYVFDILMIAAMILLATRLFGKRVPASSLADIAPAVVGLVYVPGLLAFQGLIRQRGPEWILFLYATVWAADSCAYYIGKGFGKRKLYPSVSPNKTVAGAVGSLVGGIVAALLLRSFVIRELGVAPIMLIGMTIGTLSIVGDLVESMFKRDAGVKDSGNILPGHGGILDKIDGALFAGPFLYWTLRYLG